jgi:hypothetical protein
MLFVSVRSAFGLFIGRSPAFQIDRARVQRVTNKTIRGLFYHETKRPLLPDTVVEEILLNHPLSPAHAAALYHLPLRDVGDGSVFSYRFASLDRASEESFWYLMFYNQVLCVTTTGLSRSQSGMAVTKC